MTSPFKDRNRHPLTWAQTGTKIANRLKSYFLDLKLYKLSLIAYVPSHTIRRLAYKISGVKLHSSSTIHVGARFYQPQGITIGQDTIIGDHATLDGRAPLVIGNHVDIASEVMIFNSQHDIHSPEFDPIELPVTIEDYVFIGPRAIILPGVTIGTGAVVAAGAVVTKNVPPGSVVAGVPAKVIGERGLEHYSYHLGRPRLFQ